MKCPFQPNGKHVPEWKKRYIRVNHDEQTAPQMARALDVSETYVYTYCKRQGIKPKRSIWYKDARPPGTKVTGHPYVPSYKPRQKIVQRPPAQYSNAQYTNY